MIKSLYVISFLLLGFISCALASESEDYALMGRKTWSAFECASLSSKTGDTSESERLFLVGYNSGKQFLTALSANKIKEKDLKNQVPFLMLLLLQGPSHDFILGRIYSAAEKNALDDVFNTEGKYNPDEVQKSLAENKVRKNNCRLIR